MFMEMVRIGCSFLACRVRFKKYQTCLIFHRPSPNLYTDFGSAELSCLSMACHVHFPFCPNLLPSGRGKSASLALQSW